MLKGEIEIVSERRAIFNINDKLQFLNESNTTYNKKKTKYKTKMSDRMGRIARGNFFLE
jgi:hypothetical protein